MEGGWQQFQVCVCVGVPVGNKAVQIYQSPVKARGMVARTQRSNRYRYRQYHINIIINVNVNVRKKTSINNP